MGRDVIEKKCALALLSAALAEGQETAEPAIGRAGRRVSEQLRGVLQVEPRADEKFDAHLFGGDMGAHHTGKRVRVGDGNGLMAERLRRCHQLFGVGAAAQESEVRGDIELGITGWDHPNTPCRNQPGVSSAQS